MCSEEFLVSFHEQITFLIWKGASAFTFSFSHFFSFQHHQKLILFRSRFHWYKILLHFHSKVSHNPLERIRVTGTTRWVHSPACHRLKWSRCRVSFPSLRADRQAITALRGPRMTLLMSFYPLRMPFWSLALSRTHVIRRVLFKRPEITEHHRMDSRTRFTIRRSFSHHPRITTISVIRIKHRTVTHLMDITTRAHHVQDIRITQVWA